MKYRDLRFNASRRALVAAGGALASLGVVGCSFFREPPVAFCPNDPDIGDPTTPLTIDVHAHVFNASDLQVKRFIELVAAKQGDGLGQAIGDMGGVLENLGWQLAPRADDELAMLQGLRPALDKCDVAATARTVGELRERAYRAARGDLNVALERARKARQERTLSRATTQSDFLIRNLPETRAEYLRESSARKLSREKSVQGAIDFVIQNFQYRYVSVHDYLETYSRGPGRRLDLVVAHLVDYDWWLAKGSPTPTVLKDQVRVMEQIALVTSGRVHFFAPFDPFREVAARLQGGDSSLALVQDAVRKRGALGVKLYPPMGFAAMGNATLPAALWQGRDWLPELVRRPDFGQRLDEAMTALLTWARDDQVPLMAHSNASNGPLKEFEELATPRYWKQAIEGFDTDPTKKLRVNFGHFGHRVPGQSESFIDLMSPRRGTPGAKAFADASYFSDVLENPKSLSATLMALYLKRDGVLAKRLMYGSDWQMSLVERGVDNYLADFERVYLELQRALEQQGEQFRTLSDDFFGRNAVDYLGLRKGEPARKRLDAFYNGRLNGQPGWMKKIDVMT
jgi:hypothetical protein